MSNLGQGFYKKLIQVSQNIGVRPEDLLAIMAGESNLKTDVTNSINAKGLVQFIPSTLKGLGFKGKDFAKLNGEQQLDYVEKHFKSFNFPFKSATQLYLGNFLPIALYLPGVKNEDPNTIILEKNPKTVANPNNPKDPLSKKYANAGLKLTASFERKAFLGNPLFAHGKNYVTYRDFQEQLEKNKNLQSYKEAVKELQQNGVNVQPAKQLIENDDLDKYLTKYKNQYNNPYEGNDNLEQYLSKYKQQNDNNSPLEETLDVLLKTTGEKLIVVKISSNDLNKNIFKKVLSNALKDNLICKTSLNEDELIVKAAGNIYNNFEAIKLITNQARKIFNKYGKEVETICIIKN